MMENKISMTKNIFNAFKNYHMHTRGASIQMLVVVSPYKTSQNNDVGRGWHVPLISIPFNRK
jgi:hypothetical protein